MAQWRHDHTAPTVLDNLGNVNNCINVHQLLGAAAAETRRPSAPANSDKASCMTKAGGIREERSATVVAPTEHTEDARGSDQSMRGTSDPYYLGSSAGLPDSYGQAWV